VPDLAVLGASGYAGALTAQLLWRHPAFELVAVTSRSDAGRRLNDVHPRYRVPLELEELDVDRLGERLDAAVVAYPHGASAPVVKSLRALEVRVIDLSADFRLRDPAVYEDYYGEHTAPELIADAVYGLTELHRDAVRAADLVAGPGCYPTAALLALAPVARAGLIADVVIDAKSGVSGAGREPSQATHFVSADENMNAYKVAAHRHSPEIDQELARLGSPVAATFTPHLVPLDQGELASCYVTPSAQVSAEELQALYRDAYDGEAFVEVVERPPGVRDVRDTNLCRISAHADARTGKLLVFAVIDNLWKGTASQAVQNLNLMFELPEGEGIS
jgi:N-acetyl-gamma-glutamyl-phosphate reductase